MAVVAYVFSVSTTVLTRSEIGDPVCVVVIIIVLPG